MAKKPSDQAVTPAPKKKINSKAKGGGFEGQVAKKLTAALTPLTFIRTPGSGARVGGKNYEMFGKMFGDDAMKLFVGDVVPTNERDTSINFKYSIECKSYKTPDNFTALATGNANVYKWFEESVVDSAKIDKVPMLIFKWNRTDIFVAIEKATDVLFGVKPKFELVQDRHLQIFLLDDLLQHPSFWAS